MFEKSPRRLPSKQPQIKSKPRSNTKLKLPSNPNAWKPQKLVDDQATRLYTGIMNKLTETTYLTLLSQALEITVDSAECLQRIARVIHSKAVSEPHFAPLYGKFCAQLAVKLPQFDNADTENKTDFRTTLLTMCYTTMMGEEKQQNALSLDAEENARRRRSRQKGNIMFIGELFKNKLLASSIIHACINMLIDLSDPDPDRIELCCVLTSTGGPMLQLEDCNLIDELFAKFKTLSQNRGLNNRTRFMVQDLIDLRQSWAVPQRRSSASPSPSPSPPMAAQARKTPRQSHPTTEPLSRPQNGSSPTEHPSPTKTTKSSKKVKAQSVYRAKRATATTPAEQKATDSEGGVQQRVEAIQNQQQPEKRLGSIKALLEEYYSSADLDEACRCIGEQNFSFEGPFDSSVPVAVESNLVRTDHDFAAHLVFLSVCMSFDRKDWHRNLCGSLLKESFLRGLIPSHQLTAGLTLLVSHFDDMVLDLPLFPRYLSSLFAQILDNCLQISDMCRVLMPLVHCECNSINDSSRPSLSILPFSHPLIIATNSLNRRTITQESISSLHCLLPDCWKTVPIETLSRVFYAELHAAP